MTTRPDNRVTGYRTRFLFFPDRIDYYLLFLLIMPWLLLLINQNWIFSPTGGTDPWVYFGCFNNFPEFMSAFPGTYYGTRLPAIIPGYICYKIFPPLVANYVLHLGFYYISTFSLYFIVKQTVNKRAALLGAILLGFHPFFLSAVGSDYIDGAGITYFLLTILLLTLAVKNQHRSGWTFTIKRHEQSTGTVSIPISPLSALMLFLIGISLALFIYTNTFLLAFVPVLAFYYIVMNHQYRKDPLVISLLFVVLGFVVITVLLGIVNKAVGGGFFFFMPSFSYALELVGQPNPWKTIEYTWLSYATWLVFPFLVFLSSLIYLLYSRLKKISGLKELLFQYPGIFIFCYILVFVLMLLLELSGIPVFQYTYYTCYLIPFMFITIGVLISPLPQQVNQTRFYYLIGGLMIISLIPYYLSLANFPISQISVLYPSAIVIVTFLIVMLLRLYPRFINITTMALLFVIFGVVNFTIIGSHWEINYITPDSPRKQEFLAIAKSDDIIRRFDKLLRGRFWYSTDEPLWPVYRAVASTRAWGYRLINRNFPVLEDPLIAHNGGIERIFSGTRVIILSSEDTAFEIANDTLNQAGQYAELIKEERVVQDSIEFTMTFIEVKDK